VNQTRPHCVNQMGKTHSKPLAARHGRETAWARRGHGMLCVKRPLVTHNSCPQDIHPVSGFVAPPNQTTRGRCLGWEANDVHKFDFLDFRTRPANPCSKTTPQLHISYFSVPYRSSVATE